MRALILCLVVFLAIPCYANIEAVNFKNFPDDLYYRYHVDKLLLYIEYIDHYSVKWDYPIKKDDLILLLENIKTLTEREKEKYKTNYDLFLFSLLIDIYKYNLDLIKKEEVFRNVENMRQCFPNEYRTEWLYAEYLAISAKTIESINLFRSILSKFTNYKELPPAFFDDYAEACMYAYMPKNGLNALKIACELRGISIESTQLYSVFGNAFNKTSIEKTYSETELWSIYKYNESYRLISRILGVSIPLKGSWNLNKTKYSGNTALIKIKPDRIESKKGISIGISILFIFDTSDDSIDAFIKKETMKMIIYEDKEMLINNRVFRLIKYGDPEQYKSIGGSVGYYAFASIEIPKYPGSLIEYPLDHNTIKSESKTNYISIGNIPDRFDHKLNVGILLDSCNDIFPEAENVFFSLLEQVIFE